MTAEKERAEAEAAKAAQEAEQAQAAEAAAAALEAEKAAMERTQLRIMADEKNAAAAAAAVAAAEAAKQRCDGAEEMAANASAASAAACAANSIAAAQENAMNAASGGERSELRIQADQKACEAADASAAAYEAAAMALAAATLSSPMPSPCSSPTAGGGMEIDEEEEFNVNVKLTVDSASFAAMQGGFTVSVCAFLGASMVEVTEVKTSLLAKTSVWVILTIIGTPSSQAKARWLLSKALTESGYPVSEFAAVFPASVRVSKASAQAASVEKQLSATVQGLCTSKDASLTLTLTLTLVHIQGCHNPTPNPNPNPNPCAHPRMPGVWAPAAACCQRARYGTL